MADHYRFCDGPMTLGASEAQPALGTSALRRHPFAETRGRMEEFLTDLLGATHLPPAVIAGRLLGAVVLGGVIGIEREWRARPAGLRTHILTSLAAAVFTLVTIEIMMGSLLTGEAAQADPIRVIEAVTAGVAFLAAGAIIQSSGKVQGLTTGAGMWLAGAIGVAAGLGQWTIGVAATLIGLFVIVVLAKLDIGER
jgi:putative Mg2+ transporter-C (MgtC) family protein